MRNVFAEFNWNSCVNWCKYNTTSSLCKIDGVPLLCFKHQHVSYWIFNTNAIIILATILQCLLQSKWYFTCFQYFKRTIYRTRVLNVRQKCSRAKDTMQIMCIIHYICLRRVLKRRMFANTPSLTLYRIIRVKVKCANDVTSKHYCSVF